MSLIHSAIAALERQQRAPLDAPRAAFALMRTPVRRGSARRLSTIAIAGVVVISTVAGAVWMARPAPMAAATAAAITAAPPMTAVEAAPFTAKEIASVAAAPASAPPVTGPLATALPAIELPVTGPVKQNVPRTAPVIAAPALQIDSAESARAAPEPAAPAVSTPASAPAADNIDQLAAGIRRAIDARRYDESAALLLQLAQQLPPESITLLRLRAWHALQSGDTQAALPLYRTITERLPDDEPASINFALSHWQLGQENEARRIIALLAERRPESATVRQALAQFGSRP